MADLYRTSSTTPGRILAGSLLALLGFCVGIALFTPWNKLWSLALSSMDEKLPTIGMTWEGIDRDGPFGFRVRELRLTVAKTPGTLRFRNAYVNMGLSPLATVRLDTGGTQCILEIHRNGTFDFEGDLNLTFLLGAADFKGELHASGSLFMPAGSALPKSGWIDVRSQQLILPGENLCQDLAFTAEIKDSQMAIRDLSLSQPITIKTTGTAMLDADNLYDTRYQIKGEQTVGTNVLPFVDQGTLAEVLW